MSPSRRQRGLIWLGPLVLVVAAGYAYRGVLLGEVFVGRDLFRLFIPDAVVLKGALARGDWPPLWTTHQRLGQPFLATLQSQVVHPLHVLLVAAFDAARAMTLQHVLASVLAAWGLFLSARALGVSRVGAWLSGLAFGLGPLFTQLSSLPNVALGAAASGWMLAAALGAASGGWAAIATLGLASALSFVAGSPETWLWQAVLAVILAPRDRQGVGRVGMGLAWGLALSGIVLLPAIELAAHSTRLGAGTLENSATFSSLSALWFPNADLPRSDDWSLDQHLLPTVFLGTSTLGFICFALLRGRRSRPVRVLVPAGAALALIALGGHFPASAWILSHSPLAVFRFPVKALVGVGFVASLLAGIGYDRMAARARLGFKACGRMRFVWPVVLPLVLAGLTAMIDARRGLVSGLGWALGVGIMWLAVLAWRRPWAARACAVIAAIEWSGFHALAAPPGLVAARTLERPDVQAALASIPVGARIELRPDPHDGPLDALAGATLAIRVPGLDPAHQRATIGGYGTPEPAPVSAAVDAEVADPGAFGAVAVVAVGAEGVTVEPVANPAPRAEVQTPCESPPVRWRVDDPERIVLDVRACSQGALALRDAYFPGWVARVDGEEAPIRPSGVTRAIDLPAGDHRVEFTYRPRAFVVGKAVSLVALMAMVAAWARRRST